jgi:hypothetical protein
MKSVREWDESHRVKVYGLDKPSHLDEIGERALAIIIDGIPFGDHGLPDSASATYREDIQRLNDRLTATKLLVAAGLDQQIGCLETLAPRQQATPDFDATLVDASNVRIEVSTILDDRDKQFSVALNNIAGRLYDEVEKLPAQTKSVDVMFLLPDVVYRQREVASLVSEFVEIVSNVPQDLRAGTTVYGFDATAQPIAARLGIGWSLQNRDAARPIANVRPWQFERRDIKGIVDAVDGIIAQKAAKWNDYSDGGQIPVWLVLVIESFSHYPLAAIHPISEKAITVKPFEKMIIGCVTSALLYEPDGTFVQV